MNQPAILNVPRPPGWTADHEARWVQIDTRVRKIEGGYSNDKVDRGGETKYGVSLRFLKAVGRIDTDRDGFGDLDLNFDTTLDGHDIRALTPEIASALFLDHFYLRPGFWTLPRPFDGAMFDQAVNGGTTAAIKILQRALNTFGGPRLADDGALGPLTRGRLALRIRERHPVLQAVRLAAKARYEAIVAADPSQRKYLKGWTTRAMELGRA